MKRQGAIAILATLCSFGVVGCHATPDALYSSRGVGLCALSQSAEAVVYGQVVGWRPSAVSPAGQAVTVVNVQVTRVLRGSVATGDHQLKLNGTFDPSTGTVSVNAGSQGQIERSVLEQNGRKTEGYIFLSQGNPSAIEGSGYLWRGKSGLYYSDSQFDNLDSGVTGSTIVAADQKYSAMSSCPVKTAPGSGPDGGTPGGDAGYRGPSGG